MAEPKPHILVVEDEPQMMGILAFAFETEGYRVAMAYDGQQALDRVVADPPDLVVLDVMLPKVDGFEVCRRIRTTTTIPVVMLTARKEDEDAIRGLELGADDYVTKPFNVKQLVLRVRAVLRRSFNPRRQLRVGDLEIDDTRHRATLAGAPIELTPIEFRLLSTLAANAGRVLSWQALLRHAWHVEEWEGGKEMVKTAVYRLRQKVEPDPDQPRYLQTVRGVGYLLSAPDNPVTKP
jgi:DNA-binding response OmpR family regulator